MECNFCSKINSIQFFLNESKFDTFTKILLNRLNFAFLQMQFHAILFNGISTESNFYICVKAIPHDYS